MEIEGIRIAPYIEDIGRLRIKVFREYPYLYDGELKIEQSYLTLFAHSKEGLAVIALEDDRIVGAITGAPVEDTLKQTIRMFKEKQIPTQDLFYMGDIVVLKDYQGKGIGSRLYKAFEQLVRKKGKFKRITLCEVERENKPAGVRGATGFFKMLGYVKDPTLVTHQSWKDIGDIKETQKPVVFSLKELI